MKQKEEEEKNGVDDEPQAAQQSIDYMNNEHASFTGRIHAEGSIWQI